MADAKDQIFFNGIIGSTGQYLTKPMTVEELARLAGAAFQQGDQEYRKWLARREELRSIGIFAPPSDVAVSDLGESGWGVIFSHDCDPAIIDALSPLIEHRKSAATRNDDKLFRLFKAADGYRPDETYITFLRRHQVPTAGVVEPEKMPYYLLIVGDPESIPFSFQFQLDVSYAVGRICFDRVEDYAKYAESVVLAETRGIGRDKRVRFFGVSNQNDPATTNSSKLLVNPLAAYAETRKNDWEIDKIIGETATKNRLLESIAEKSGPAFLFTASHGMGFFKDDKRQESCQGALLCQDWPGPLEWSREIPDDFFLSADDISDADNVHGLISFHFACYGAGTPRFDDYGTNFGEGRQEIAARSFIGALPKKLLSHPKGGALACVGHIERAWSYSFISGKDAAIRDFQSTFNNILKGVPIGHAMNDFNTKYAQIASQIASVFEDDRFKPESERTHPDELVPQWIEHNDARSYVILGDPFVRLMPDRVKFNAALKSESISEIKSNKTSDYSKTSDSKKIAEAKKPTIKEQNAKKVKKSKGGGSDEISDAIPANIGASAFELTAPEGFQDITNYLFVDDEAGRQLTVTVSVEKIEEAQFIAAAWSHVSSASNLLGAREVRLGELERAKHGGSLLIASYLIGEGTERSLEFFGISRLLSGRCVQLQLRSKPDDKTVESDFRRFCHELEETGGNQDVSFAVNAVREDSGLTFTRIGQVSLSIPAGYQPPNTYQFLSDNGTKRVDVEFESVKEEGATSFASQAVIGSRTQFLKVKEVPMFLRNPIRYEEPNFAAVGAWPGAIAFEAKTGGVSPEKINDHPAFQAQVDIKGRKAEVRYYSDFAMTDEVLEKEAKMIVDNLI
jgi:hypothetical protein